MTDQFTIKESLNYNATITNIVFRYILKKKLSFKQD